MRSPNASPVVRSGRSKLLLQFGIVAVIATLITFSVWPEDHQEENRQPKQPSVSATSPKQVPQLTTGGVPLQTSFAVEPKTLDELLALPVEDLGKVDIARMNLLCATDLPGAEDMDIEALLARLDAWARRIVTFTSNKLPEFFRRPHDFDNSQARFLMLAVLSALQTEFGVHYQKDGKDVNYNNALYPLILGMMQGKAGGNCASMPVMYVAVGRRLGYPVSLMLAKNHILARWDGTAETGANESKPIYRERFNIEGTNPMLVCHPDSYYRQSPYPVIRDEEMALGWYLKPLTAAEELAVFLAIRGHVLLENERFAEALHAFKHSRRYAPHNPKAKFLIVLTQDALNNQGMNRRLAEACRRRGIGTSNHLATVSRNQVIDGRNYQGISPLVAQRMAAEQRIIQAGQQQFMQQRMTPPSVAPVMPSHPTQPTWPRQPRHARPPTYTGPTAPPPSPAYP